MLAMPMYPFSPGPWGKSGGDWPCRKFSFCRLIYPSFCGVNGTAGIYITWNGKVIRHPSALWIKKFNVLYVPAESPVPACSSSTECTTSQCQNTASPGLTFGTEIIISSNFKLG